MNCKRAKTEIALWVGNDLGEEGQQELKRHLSQCPSCRAHWLQLKSCMAVLQKPTNEHVGALRASMWPRVKVHLAWRMKQGRPQRFNGWVPAAAVVAACLTIMAFNSSNSHSPAQARFSSSPVDVSPVNISWPSVGSGGLFAPVNGNASFDDDLVGNRQLIEPGFRQREMSRDLRGLFDDYTF